MVTFGMIKQLLQGVYRGVAMNFKTSRTGMFVIKIGRLLGYIYHVFLYEGMSFRAASLAYTTLLAMVPVMIIGFSILSFFPVFQGVGVRIQTIILQNFTAASAGIIVKYL